VQRIPASAKEEELSKSLKGGGKVFAKTGRRSGKQKDGYTKVTECIKFFDERGQMRTGKKKFSLSWPTKRTFSRGLKKSRERAN